MPTPEKTKTISFLVDPKLDLALNVAANALGHSKQDLMANAAEEYLKNPNLARQLRDVGIEISLKFCVAAEAAPAELR